MKLQKAAVMTALAMAALTIPAPSAQATSVTACIDVQKDTGTEAHCEKVGLCFGHEGTGSDSPLVEQVTGTDLYDTIDDEEMVCVTP